MNVEQKERKSDIANATKRKDQLQKLIDDLGKYNTDLVDKNLLRGQDDLESSDYLNVFANFLQEHKDSEYQQATYEAVPN